MFNTNFHFARRLVCVILLITTLWMSGCGPSTPTTVVVPTSPNPISTSTPEPTAISPGTPIPTLTLSATPIPTLTLSATPIPTLTPSNTPIPTLTPSTTPILTLTPSPTALAPAEGWEPYPKDVAMKGDARLVMGYEKMRNGVYSLNAELQKLLSTAGLKINTARTVILPDTIYPVKLPDIFLKNRAELITITGDRLNSLFSQKSNPVITEERIPFPFKGTDKGGTLLIRVISQGEQGTPAEGLYGYMYQIQLPGPKVDGEAHCIDTLRINFGPPAALDYNNDKIPDYGFRIAAETTMKIEIADQKYSPLTFRFNPPVCAGKKNEDTSPVFGMASTYPPSGVEVLLRDSDNITFPVKAMIPAFKPEQKIEVRVAVAPAMAAKDPKDFSLGKMQEMLAGEGLILGMMVIETNAQDTQLPSGAYLERAFLKNGIVRVEFIEVTSGQVVFGTESVNTKSKDESAILPETSIFLGNPQCLHCWLGWWFCWDCTFLDNGPQYEPSVCKALVDNKK